MKTFFLSLALILTFSISSISTVKAQASPEALMENFFAIFEDDVNQAIDFLFATNPMIDPNQQGIQSIKERLELSRKLLGNYNGYELVTIYNAGDSYAKYIYSIKYDRQPVKFEVVLYRPKDTWKVQNCNFKDDIEVEFKVR